MKIRKSLLTIELTILTIAICFSTGAYSQTGKKMGEGAGTGAVLGALAGVVFGKGDIIEDAANAAIRGAAAGAAVGFITAKTEEGEKKQPEETAPSESDKQAKEAEQAQQAIEELNQIFGKDNVESYFALQACEHKRAHALAQAGEASRDANYRLTAVWMQAMIAVDNRDSGRAETEFERLVVMDPDIDTQQQASLETDKLVLEMRNERRQMGLPSCNE